MRNAPIAALAAVSFVFLGAPLQAQEDAKVIEEGSTVSIEYTLKLADGSTADTNVGGEPLVYVQGEQQILPALEGKLLGMKPEETREVTLTPEEGYGPVHEEGFQTVPLDIIPEEAREVGARLVGQGPQGEPLHATVKEINEDSAVVDLNHPLAGEDLHFSIRVINVE
ncbi:MAG: FKBP-type peptidyl-prolyl cis-trans isomerase [Gammaproteobacteria bacterium]